MYNALHVAILCVFGFGAASVGANSVNRPLIRVSCPADMPELCQALIRAINDTGTSGAVVRQVARGAETPTQPGDIGIALHMQAVSDAVLSGHLAWQTARHPMQEAEAVRMDQMDAPMNAASYRNFARNLLQASVGVVAALRAPL